MTCAQLQYIIVVVPNVDLLVWDGHHDHQSGPGDSGPTLVVPMVKGGPMDDGRLVPIGLQLPREKMDGMG